MEIMARDGENSQIQGAVQGRKLSHNKLFSGSDLNFAKYLFCSCKTPR